MWSTHSPLVIPSTSEGLLLTLLELCSLPDSGVGWGIERSPRSVPHLESEGLESLLDGPSTGTRRPTAIL